MAPFVRANPGLASIRTAPRDDGSDEDRLDDREQRLIDFRCPGCRSRDRKAERVLHVDDQILAAAVGQIDGTTVLVSGYITENQLPEQGSGDVPVLIQPDQIVLTIETVREGSTSHHENLSRHHGKIGIGRIQIDVVGIVRRVDKDSPWGWSDHRQ